jgi:hypothetical protein
MKTLIALFIVGISSFSFGQSFELNKDLGDEKVAYQGVVELDSLDKEDLMKLAKSWSAKDGIDQELVSSDEEIGMYEFSELYKVIGKKSEMGKEYDYRFTSKLKLEFKDNKVRYTFYEFKKRTSPGEPGSSLEYYIENYNQGGVSIKSKTRDAIRLDEIELELHEQVNNVIFELKNHFASKKEEW